MAKALTFPWLVAVALILGFAGPLAAADVAGSADHPAIGARYPGASIVRYDVSAFDEYPLLLGVTPDRGVAGEHEALEGKITRISYEIDAERSTLEVMRNYELALTEKGFGALWNCKNETCGGRSFNHTVVPYWQGFAENYEDQRYLAAKATVGDVPTYVAVYVVKNLSEGGPRHGRVYAQLDVIELQPMQTGLEVVEAEAMQKAFDAEGHVALYGILFDLDSADLKPESRPALDEIAILLKESPAMKLYVVGHTDHQGTLAYNLDLSERRATSVARDLTATYGIDAGRLSAHGVGFLSPVATNATEDGRQQNRRVELLPQ